MTLDPDPALRPPAAISKRPAVALRIRRADLRDLPPVSRPAPGARFSRWAIAGSAGLHVLAFLLLMQTLAPAPRESVAENLIVVTLRPPPEPTDREPPLPEPPGPPPAMNAPIVFTPEPAPFPLVAAITNPVPGELTVEVKPASTPAWPGATPEPETEEEAWTMVRNAIHQHLVYPESARRRGEEGRVILRVTVAPDGRLTALEAESDGASPRLVHAALAAAHRAAPFGRTAAGRHAVPVFFRLQSEARDHVF